MSPLHATILSYLYHNLDVLRCLRVRPAIVMANAAGLALKDHGRGQTLKGLLVTASVAAR